MVSLLHRPRNPHRLTNPSPSITTSHQTSNRILPLRNHHLLHRRLHPLHPQPPIQLLKMETPHIHPITMFPPRFRPRIRRRRNDRNKQLVHGPMALNRFGV